MVQPEYLFSNLPQNILRDDCSLYQSLIPAESLTDYQSPKTETWDVISDRGEETVVESIEEDHIAYADAVGDPNDLHPIASIMPTTAKSRKINRTAAFKCPHCPRTFGDAQGLGGHMSQQHKGHSKKHAFKQAKRKEKEPDRLALSLTYKLLGQYDCSELSKDKYSRVRWELKKHLIEQDEFKKLVDGEKVFNNEDEAAFLNTQVVKICQPGNCKKYLREAITLLRAQEDQT